MTDRDAGQPDQTNAAAAEEKTDVVELTESTTEQPTHADAAEGDEDYSLEPDKAESKRNWMAVAAVVVAPLLILALAALGTLGWLWKVQRDKDIAAEQALVAAQHFAAVITSVDSARIDDNVNQTMDGSTGDFKSMYARSSAQLRQLMLENKAMAHGVVVDAAVKSATKDKVEVLLFIDQSVSNIQVPDPRLDRSRVQMTMEKVDGRWLASELTLV